MTLYLAWQILRSCFRSYLLHQKNHFSPFFYSFFLYKTEEKTLKKLGYVCYGTPSPYQNIWWREAGAKPFFQWKKHKKQCFWAFFSYLLPDKLPNSRKNSWKCCVWDFRLYIEYQFLFSSIFFHYFSLFFEPPSRTLKFCLFKAPGAPLWPPIAPHGVRCIVLCSNHVT